MSNQHLPKDELNSHEVVLFSVEGLDNFPQSAAEDNKARGPVLIQSTGATEPPLPLWAQRLFLIVKVIFYIELGLMLAVLPWTSVWNQNEFVMRYPSLRELMQNNFTLGLFTGLGLIDIWLGIWEAAHYRDIKH